MDSVDTLVYQMEDDDGAVKLEAIRRLRELAAQLQLAPPPAAFPVRNARRFLNCVRRRLHDPEPRVVIEALQFVCDLIPVIGVDNLVHLYQIVLPPMLPLLPADAEWHDDATFPHSALHVLWVYAQHTKDFQSVLDLLMNQGFNHDDGGVRQAAIGGMTHLLARNASATLPSDVEWSMILEVLIPAMEDDEEASVVAAEEAVAWLQGHLGLKRFQRLVQDLNGRDRSILAQHHEFIQQFVAPSTTVVTDDQMQFGFVPKWIVDALQGPGDAPLKTTAIDLLGRTLSPLAPAELLAARTEWPRLFGFLAHVCALTSPIQNEALVIVDALSRTLGTYLVEVTPVLLPMLASVLVDPEQPARLRSLVHLVVGADSVAATVKALVPALQHAICKVREAACQLWTVAALLQPREGHPGAPIVALHLGRLLSDPSPVVRGAAADLAAVLVRVCAVPVLDILRADCDGCDFVALEQRLRQRDLPVLQLSGPHLLRNSDVDDKSKLWLTSPEPPLTRPRVPPAAVVPAQPSAEHIAKNLLVLKQRCLNKKRSSTPEAAHAPSERSSKAATPVEAGAYAASGDRDQHLRAPFENHPTNEDRPIKPMRANLFAEVSTTTPDDDPLEQTAVRARTISLATSKRLKAKEIVTRPVGPEPEVNAEPISEKPRVMTLATRKRLEAKLKLDEATTAPPASSARGGKLKTGDELRTALRAGKQEYLTTGELAEYPLGKADWSACLARLGSAEWEDQFEGLTDLRRLAVHVPEVVGAAGFSACVQDVCRHIGNLRSAVAKNAMLAIETLSLHVVKRMDAELDDVVPLLLKRAADTNAFLSEAGRQTLDAVVAGCAPSRVLAAVLPQATSKNCTVRKYVAVVLGKLAAGRLDVSRDADRLLATVCAFVNDSSNEVRDAAKPTLLALRQAGLTDASRLRKVCPASCLGRVEQVLLASSAPPRTPPTETKTLVRVRSDKDTKYKPVANAEFDRIPLLNTQLESSNWKDRFDALEDVRDLVLKHAGALCQSGKILHVFDGLNKRFEDGNAKVNVLALEALQAMIPALGNGLEAVLATLVPVLTRGLASNNQKVAQLADGALDLLCQHVDAKLLCQHFATVAKAGNTRVKPGMLQKLDRLTQDTAANSQFALHRYVLPLALDLIKESKTDVREANYKLLRSLYRTLGPAMLDSAYKLPKPHQDKLSQIIGVHITTA
ncbi:hypothetical protein ACHHYP_16518 [Achlya hypogyna]|uniref:TOG domain-containing protein n=1 Tax=Achlya hypogyna TaxID=1202772 RepID=A0A1V9Y6D3_ACHHY|nr:hypothetical protein ACHHYP_16518 [Achlya hypogyna]